MTTAAASPGESSYSASQKHIPSCLIAGVTLHALSRPQTIACVVNSLSEQLGGWVVTANLDHLRRLVHESSYRQLCSGATLMVADGMPLIWASRIQGTPLPERVAGSDLIWSLSQALAKEGRSIFLLGGESGTAEAAGRVLAGRYPGLKIAGCYCPPVGFDRDPQHLARIRSMLVEAGPDMVYVALGSPKQEKLIAELREELPAAWWMGVGISFSFVTGDVKRAPRWVQAIGMEWVHRLVQEPRRLFSRYLVDDLPFALDLFGVVLLNRLRRGRASSPAVGRKDVR